MKNDQDLDKNQKILNKIIQKDETTLNEIFPELKTKVKLFLWWYGKYSKDYVHDLVCDTLVVVFQMEKVKLTTSYIWFLMSIATKIWYNKQRNKKEIPLQEKELELAAAVNRIFVESEDWNILLLDIAMSKLTDKERKILYYHTNNYDPNSAAQNLKYKSVDVYNIMRSRTLKKLKNIYFYLLKHEKRTTQNNT